MFEVYNEIGILCQKTYLNQIFNLTYLKPQYFYTNNNIIKPLQISHFINFTRNSNFKGLLKHFYILFNLCVIEFILNFQNSYDY